MVAVDNGNGNGMDVFVELLIDYWVVKKVVEMGEVWGGEDKVVDIATMIIVEEGEPVTCGVTATVMITIVC